MMPNSYDVMKASMDETNPERRNAARHYAMAWESWEASKGTDMAPICWKAVEIEQANFFGLDWS